MSKAKEEYEKLKKDVWETGQCSIAGMYADDYIKELEDQDKEIVKLFMDILERTGQHITMRTYDLNKLDQFITKRLEKIKGKPIEEIINE